MRELSNNEVKYINKLYLAKYRKEEKKFIVEGKHLVNEAKKAGVLLECYTTDEDFPGDLISEASMKKVCKTNTTVNALGICKLFEAHKLSDKILVLDAIQDPGNLGTLMRSAKAFGFDTILLGRGTVDIYNDKVIRSSQGAIFKLNFINDDIKSFMNEHQDYEFYGTDVVKGVEAEAINPGKKIAIILGNEGNGMQEELKDLTKANIYIPLINTESLNVSVAGSILMYLFK